jgi:two-component system, OmpR family, alkaline phosphatase synthesis response regulator PhoP
MSGISILVAEDAEETANLIKFALEKAGFQVELVTNGLDALKSIEKKTPDLLITDILMPGMNGFELMEELSKRTLKIKTIVLAVQKSDEDIVRGLGYGALDFIQKPFSPREMVARVKGIMSR